MKVQIWQADNGDGTYRNPIINSDYSDPDVIRVGNDYFMVASSFCNAPAIPLLHSTDLVGWRVVNYVTRRLPFDSYDEPRHGSGAWAPAIRYHSGLYYVFVPYPDEGIAVYTASDPFGKWSDAHFVIRARGWIDPCPFWDDDGTLYMVNAFAKSRIGFKSALYLCRLLDGENGLWADTDSGGFIYDGHATQPTVEGPKLYKRDGYYYIFAPAGGVKTGWQAVFRSRNIMGPYEERKVLHQGDTPINGPHQGAWVDTPSGEDWFIHFQDAGSVGRVVHLQPMHWQDGWPVIGSDPESCGCGTPVLSYKKPDLPTCGYVYPDSSDSFDSNRLGLQWQWNANPGKDWYRAGGGLFLKAVPREGRALRDLPNLLLQKWPTDSFELTVSLSFERLDEGCSGGVVSLGGIFDALIVIRRYGKLALERRTIQQKSSTETLIALRELSSDRLYVKMRVERGETVAWSFSEDGERYESAGEPSQALPGVWVGVKVGLTAFSDSEGSGELTAKYFRFEPIDHQRTVE